MKVLQDSGFFLMMLTKIPSENPLAASEKIMWLNEHAPFMDDHIIISPDKGCVGTDRDFLVDDFPEWANAHSFAGTVVQFGGFPKSITLDRGFGWAADWGVLVDLIMRHANGR